MNDDLRVATLEALITEVDEGLGTFRIRNPCTAARGCENVRKKLETDLMVVLHDFFLRVLHVLAQEVADHRDFNHLPVSLKNILGLVILQDQETE